MRLAIVAGILLCLPILTSWEASRAAHTCPPAQCSTDTECMQQHGGNGGPEGVRG